ncbi:MAG: hypothetical protein CMJ46_02230 [Planctomyces sp.]|nr:hypothetical protein [Planctomyces sp.]
MFSALRLLSALRALNHTRPSHELIRRRRTSSPGKAALEGLESRVLLSAVDSLTPPLGETTSATVEETDLRVEKISNQTTVSPGQTVTFQTQVENRGFFSVDDIHFVDQYSHFLENVSWTAVGYGASGFTSAGTGDIDEILELGSDASITYNVTGTVRGDVYGSVTSTAMVSSATYTDSNPDDNIAGDSDLVVLVAAESSPGMFQEYITQINDDLRYRTGFVAGDIDGDGDNDIVATFGSDVGQPTSPTEIWINNGYGEFTTGTGLATVDRVAEKLMGDLDGDQDLDLFFITRQKGYQIWLNDGSGNFSQIAPTFPDASRDAGAIGDVDGDGDLDILAVGAGAGIEVLLNDGSGGFSSAGTFGTTGYDVALGDLDSDGDLDAFIGSSSGGDQVWINDGSGAFTDSGQSLGDRNTRYVELIDYDKDGDLDAVSATYDTDPPTTAQKYSLLWVNDGDGVFSQGDTIWTDLVTGFVAGDLRGNGFPDLVLGQQESNRGEIYLNSGGVFNGRTYQTPLHTLAAIELADFNGDQQLDLLVQRFYEPVMEIWFNADGPPVRDVSISKVSNQVVSAAGDEITFTITVTNEGELPTAGALVSDDVDALLENATWTATLNGGASGATSGAGSISESVDLPVGARIEYTVTGTLKDGFFRFVANTATVEMTDGVDAVPDNNLDTDIDLFVETTTGGHGQFISGQVLREFVDSGAVELGDLDGDGDLDIILGVRDEREQVEIWLNDGQKEFFLYDSIAVNEFVRGIAVADLDGDGALDLFITTRRDDEVWINDGTGRFNERAENIVNANAYGNAVGDLNGDGRVDLIVPTNNVGINIYWNKGNDNYTASPVVLGTDSRGVAIGDLDGDGDLDLFVVDPDEPDQVWFNDGYGNFTEGSQSFGLSFSESINLADLDGDGDLDAVIATFQDDLNIDNQSRIWLNDGTGQFAAGQLLNTNFVEDIEVGDLDGDGDLDLLISDYEVTGSSIWLNNGSAEFTRTFQNIPSWFSSASKLGDLDGDGDLDAILATFGGKTTVLWNDMVALPFSQNFEQSHWSGVNVAKDVNAGIVIDNQSKALQLTSNNYPGLTTAVVGTASTLPEQVHIRVDMEAIYASGIWADGFIIFDYQSDNDFKYAGAFVGQNQWVIGHYQGYFDNRLAQVDWDDTGRTINPGRSYRLDVSIDGDQVGLTVDGEFITSATFANPVTDGRAGLAVYNAITNFDNFQLSEPATLPYSEDFQDGTSGQLVETNPALWTVSPHSGEYHYLTDSTSTNGMAASLLPTTEPLPSFYVVHSKMTAVSGPDRWQDGFLIFDYKNDKDFKYAAMFAGQNQWVIGHYQGHFGNRLAQVDWDDTGRDIYTDTFYFVRVEISNNTATLYVNDGEVASATFAGPLNGGQAGVGAYNAVTQFDDIYIGSDFEDYLQAPYYEQNFYSGGTEVFTPSNPALWSLEGGENNEYTADSTTTGGLAVSTMTLSEVNGDVPGNLLLGTEVQVREVPGHWSDGFIVFDYRNEQDFKYAGYFAGQNQWVIGHFRGHFGSRLVEVDWDDEGRDIHPNALYEFHVEIIGDEATLIADGMEIGTADFNVPLNHGTVGMAAYNSRTSFLGFTATVLELPISSLDNAFAEYDGGLVE